ncbi:hypothetical protein WA158_008027 [Blastocystis sp. Blastoise]
MISTINYLYATLVAVAAKIIYDLIYKYKSIPSQVGKSVWIIGASSGIGKAVAKDYYLSGANVTISSRRQDALDTVKSEFEALKPNATNKIFVVPLDIEQIDTFEDKTKQVEIQMGQIDILVMSSGLGIRSNSRDVKQEIEDKVMNTNFRGPVALAKIVLNGMRSRKQGNLVFISSIQGLLSVPARACYCAAKHALQGYCDALRAEEKKNGIHIMVVSPAYVKTNHSLSAVTGDGKTYGKMDKTTEKGMSPEQLSHDIIFGIKHNKYNLINAPIWMKAYLLLGSILQFEPLGLRKPL